MRHLTRAKVRTIGNPDIARALRVEDPCDARRVSRGHQSAGKRRAQDLLEGKGSGVRENAREDEKQCGTTKPLGVHGEEAYHPASALVPTLSATEGEKDGAPTISELLPRKTGLSISDFLRVLRAFVVKGSSEVPLCLARLTPLVQFPDAQAEVPVRYDRAGSTRVRGDCQRSVHAGGRLGANRQHHCRRRAPTGSSTSSMSWSSPTRTPPRQR